MRARTLIIASLLVAVGAFAVAALFASGDDRSRNDALLFLDRYEGLDIDDPIDQREPLVDGLARIPLSSERVRRIRDACVEAHRTLIRAEQRGADARAAFERATAGGRTDLTPEERSEIDGALADSEQALPVARERLGACMDDVRDLRLRFRPQHARH
jgi:hypothetical protein